VSDKPYELAYEASIRAIEDQARVLESVRSRAGTLFAATALVTSFFGGAALSRAVRNGSDLHPISYTGAAVALFVVLALLTLTTLLPFRLRFSISAGQMLEIVETRETTTNPVSAKEAYREVALRNEAMYDFNAERIRALLWCFRIAIVCLVAEVALWIVVLWRGEP
jgi:hypothetical protein